MARSPASLAMGPMNFLSVRSLAKWCRVGRCCRWSSLVQGLEMGGAAFFLGVGVSGFFCSELAAAAASAMSRSTWSMAFSLVSAGFDSVSGA